MKRTIDSGVMRDLAARAAIGALFVLLSWRFLEDFIKTGRVTGLLFLISEALVVILTIVRRPARSIDRTPAAALLTLVSVIGSPLVRPTDMPPLAPDLVTALISTVGVVIVIAGKLTIGRSFGLIPANRGVVSSGPYSVVRHPIYAGYMLTHVATLVSFPSALNVALILISDTAQVFRALAEERVLSGDREYQSYCGRVAWHLVPGVF